MSSLPQAEPAWLTAEVSRLPQFMSWWSKAGLVGLCSTPAETQERTNLSWVHVESDPASSKLIDRLWAYCNVLVLHVYHWSAIAGHKKAMRKIGNRLKKLLFCNFCCNLWLEPHQWISKQAAPSFGTKRGTQQGFQKPTWSCWTTHSQQGNTWATN